MTVPVDTLAATVREGFASGRSIFAKDAADEALAALVARATKAEADRQSQAILLREADTVITRLREERNAARRVRFQADNMIVVPEDRALRAEDRCARLQQALRAYEVAFSQWDAQGGIYLGAPAARQWRSIAREALAGPDTPADTWTAEELGEARETARRQGEAFGWRAADSQPEETTT